MEVFSQDEKFFPGPRSAIHEVQRLFLDFGFAMLGRTNSSARLASEPASLATEHPPTNYRLSRIVEEAAVAYAHSHMKVALNLPTSRAGAGRL